MAKQKLPLDLPATHEYKFTRSMRMQYNSEHHVVRIFYRDQLIQDWAPPSITVDLTKFQLLPIRPRVGNYEDTYRKLQRKGDLPAFMAKWINRLTADEYAELLEDARVLIILAETEAMMIPEASRHHAQLAQATIIQSLED